MRGIFAAVALLVAACGTEDEDSWGPVSYTIYTRPETGPSTPLAVRIDGESAQSVTRVFTDAPTFLDKTITVELHDGDHVAESVSFDLSEYTTTCYTDGAEAELSLSLCRYSSGELRLETLNAMVSGDWCVGDGFCYSRCGPLPGSACGANEKCGSAFSAADLRYSRMQCQPAGTRTVGQTCNYTAGADGRFIDDCTSGSVCVAGTCRWGCSSNASCASGEVCSELAGHNTEIRACLAQP